MVDKDTPNRSANKDKAEGERWSSEQDVIPNSESSTDRSYGDDDGDNAGGITNRPLEEEIDTECAAGTGQSQADTQPQQ